MLIGLHTHVQERDVADLWGPCHNHNSCKNIAQAFSMLCFAWEYWLLVSLTFLVNSPASSRVEAYTASSQLAQELTQGLLLAFSPAVWEVSYGQAGWRMLRRNTLFQTQVSNWQLRTKAGLGWSPWMLDLAKALSSKHRWGVR